ncbi:Ferric reductase transmembrane component 3 [Colletotrichum tanaceti]|uniref:Ferric reductase transmembrane component 3 n=1 Tax=Colletotrichum tanaceti TaxID=1306861 RepID=A0A4U6X489_9PEZI|nr:Ferric reductase transmembrane component 3 [Colletotrichum tanaceti]TKW49834.1 Ferric reductase transmembrane component 3 [Colletotrichum tanaceti]
MPLSSDMLLGLLVGASGLSGVAGTGVGEPGYGLIGYGITMYQPLCAYACRVALSASPLNCSSVAEMNGKVLADTPSSCYATDDAFLVSLAWCIHTRCVDISVWEIEKYWHSTEASVRSSHRRLDEPGVKVNAHPPVPKWTYQEALRNVNQTPTATLSFASPLKEKVLVSDADYFVQHNTMGMFEKMEVNHETYGLILIALGAAVPILFSLLRFVPLPALLVSKINAVFIDPPLMGRRHKVPYFNMLIMPTRGQTVLIAYLVIVNVVLSGIGYESAQPNAWWVNDKDQELLTSFSDRMGVLSFANFPLLILYAGRNNFLYWFTDYTQSTFMLLHRWTAYFCTIQACLHSAAWLQIYISMDQHATEAQLPYWIWGIIAALALSFLLPASAIPFREKLYELFLALHIILGILALVGSYLHIIYRFQNQWGYEVWMYLCFAIWGFDRLARLLRMARNGLLWANINIIDEDYLQINITDAVGNGHAYLYFPTLSWRPWESHPFSILKSRVSPFATGRSSIRPGPVTKDSCSKDSSSTDTSPVNTESHVGLSFLVRSFSGTTKLLRSHSRLPVFVEAGYLPHRNLDQFETLVCIIGGVAITAVTHVLHAYPGNAKLYWSARSDSLVQRVSLDGIDTSTSVHARFELCSVLEEEIGRARGSIAIIVSGPATMVDEGRCLVSKLALKAPVPVTFIDETYVY